MVKIFKYLLCLVISLTLIVPVSVVNAVGNNFANIVVFVRFSNDTNDYFNSDTDAYTDLTNYTKIREMYDHTQTNTLDKSLTSYVANISDNKLLVENIFPQANGATTDILTLTVSYADCQNFSAGGSDYPIVRDVANYLKNNSAAFSGKTLDYNHDGYIDNVSIIIQGDSTSIDGIIYPHKYFYSSTEESFQGVSIGNYNIVDSASLVKNTSDDVDTIRNQSGVLIHELLHSVGFPDLYQLSGSGTPVGIWSIMASTGPYLQYPLEYLLQDMGWITMPTISSAGDYSLNLNTSTSGTRVYKIATGRNAQEFFCIEYRYGGNDWQNDAYDAKMPSNGLLVYRVNESYADRGNADGDNYLYVIRPDASSPSDALESINDSLYKAAVGPDNAKWTSIGSTDLTKDYRDNTIYYSDGSNSGIAISEIKYSADKTSISFHVDFAEYDEDDYWQPVISNTSIMGNDLAYYDSKIIVASTSYDNSGNVITNFTYDNNGVSTKFANSVSLSSPVLYSGTSGLYLAGLTNNGLALYKYTNGNFQLVRKLNNVYANDYGFLENDGKLYDYYTESVGFDNSTLIVEETTNANKLNSYPGVAYSASVINYQGSIIASIKDSKGSKILRYTNGAFEVINETNVGNYAEIKITSTPDKLYAVTYNNSITPILKTYDGTNWTSTELTSLKGISDLSLTAKDDIVYFASVKDSVSKVNYLADGELVQLKDNLLNDAYEIASQIVGDKLYALISDSNEKAYLKVTSLPQLTVSLDSLSVEGNLSKVDYLVDEDLDITGATIVAHYSNNTTADVTALVSLPSLSTTGEQQSVNLEYENKQVSISGINVYSLIQATSTNTNISKHGLTDGKIVINILDQLQLKGDVEVSLNDSAYDNKLTYSNLSSGDYVLKIRDSELPRNITTLNITLVQPEVTDFTVTPNKLYLKPGESSQLEADIEVSNGGSEKVIWSSNNTNITVVDGLVTAKESAVPNDYEVYACSEEDQTKKVTIVVSVYETGKLQIELPEGYSDNRIFIDGKEIVASKEGNVLLASLDYEDAMLATIYHYKENGAPDGMRVYQLTYQDGNYQATLIPELNDLISYHGFSMRVKGITGVRFKSGIDVTTKKQLRSTNGLAGYHLVETGTLIMNKVDYSSEYPLIKGGDKTGYGRAYYKDGTSIKDIVFETINSRARFASVVTKIKPENYDNVLSFRAYVILEKDGKKVIVYGPIVSKSMYDVAIAVKASGQFTSGSQPDLFIQNIIDIVEGGN